MLPIHKAHYSKLTKATAPIFIASSKDLLQERVLLKVLTSDRFDPNAYKLIEKFGFCFNKLAYLWHIIEAKSYGLNDIKNDTKIGWQRHNI